MSPAGDASPYVHRIRDPDDPHLADYRGLRDVTLRRSLEAAHGLFIAEDKVVRRAVAAGYRPRSYLLAERWLPGLADLVAATGVACYVVDEAVAERLVGFHVHRGALASMHRRALAAPADLLAGARRVIVLEDVVDHTNVGAVLRSAAALGVQAALLSPRCADPLYRRAVKVSMGAVFSLPWARVADWWDAVPQLSATGFTTVALTPADDAVDLADVDVDGRLAVLVGSEGPGLSSRWQRAADVRARIPMAAGVDSLNVAAAAAVACYALRPSAGP